MSGTVDSSIFRVVSYIMATYQLILRVKLELVVHSGKFTRCS